MLRWLRSAFSTNDALAYKEFTLPTLNISKRSLIIWSPNNSRKESPLIQGCPVRNLQDLKEN